MRGKNVRKTLFGRICWVHMSVHTQTVPKHIWSGSESYLQHYWMDVPAITQRCFIMVKNHRMRCFCENLFRVILTRSLPKGFEKQDLLCIWVSMSFRVNNFRNTQDMRLIFFFFFSKCSKFKVDSQYAMKMQQNNFGFSDNCIWIDRGKFSLLLREYL